MCTPYIKIILCKDRFQIPDKWFVTVLMTTFSNVWLEVSFNCRYLVSLHIYLISVHFLKINGKTNFLVSWSNMWFLVSFVFFIHSSHTLLSLLWYKAIRHGLKNPRSISKCSFTAALKTWVDILEPMLLVIISNVL